MPDEGEEISPDNIDRIGLAEIIHLPSDAVPGRPFSFSQAAFLSILQKRPALLFVEHDPGIHHLQLGIRRAMTLATKTADQAVVSRMRHP